MTHFSPIPHRSSAGSRILLNLALHHGITGDTEILTQDGCKRADTLRPGDRIISRDLGTVRLRAMVSRTPAEPQDMVHIPAHAFGQGRPAQDMMLLADQPIVIRDWRAPVLYGRTQAHVAASRLVDGNILTATTCKTGKIFALHFPRPVVLYANGLEIMSAGTGPSIGQVG